MNDIDALLMGPPTDEQEMQALAASLRGDQEAGRFFGMSTIPQLSKMGQNVAQQAGNRAGSIGNKRFNLERDSIQHQRGLDKATTAFDRRMQEMERRGEMEQGLQVLRNAGRTGGTAGGTRGLWKGRTDPVTGVRFDVNTGTGEIAGHDGKIYPDAEAYTAAHPDLRAESIAAETEAAAREASAKGDEAREKRLGKVRADRQMDAVALYEGLNQQRETVEGMAAQIRDKGALVGPVMNLFPDFRDATVTFKSLKNSLALQAIGNYKLYPLSDKDVAIVKSSVAPDISGSGFLEWADKRSAAIDRLEVAQGMLVEYMDANGSRQPIGADRRALQAATEAEIRKRGLAEDQLGTGDRKATATGFKPADELDAKIEALEKELGL